MRTANPGLTPRATCSRPLRGLKVGALMPAPRGRDGEAPYSSQVWNTSSVSGTSLALPMSTRAQVFQRRMASSLAGWPDRDGLLVVLHGLAEPAVGAVDGARTTALQVSFRPSLAEDPAVVEPAVLVVEPPQCASRAGSMASPRLSSNWSLNDNSNMTRASWLSGSTSRTSRQMLSASRGSLKQTVALRLLERGGDGISRKGLQLEHGPLPPGQVRLRTTS